MVDRGRAPCPPVILKELGSADIGGMLEMLSRCSKRTLFHRFHGFSDGAAHVVDLTTGDRGRRTVVARCGELCVGFATLSAGEADAHVGVFVEDSWHRLGIGSRLFASLLHLARGLCLPAIHLDVLAEDAFILRPLSRVAPLRFDLAWGVYSVAIDLDGSGPAPVRHHPRGCDTGGIG